METQELTIESTKELIRNFARTIYDAVRLSARTEDDGYEANVGNLTPNVDFHIRLTPSACQEIRSGTGTLELVEQTLLNRLVATAAFDGIGDPADKPAAIPIIGEDGLRPEAWVTACMAAINQAILDDRDLVTFNVGDEAHPVFGGISTWEIRKIKSGELSAREVAERASMVAFETILKEFGGVLLAAMMFPRKKKGTRQ